MNIFADLNITWLSRSAASLHMFSEQQCTEMCRPSFFSEKKKLFLLFVIIIKEKYRQSKVTLTLSILSTTKGQCEIRQGAEGIDANFEKNCDSLILMSMNLHFK